MRKEMILGLLLICAFAIKMSAKGNGAASASTFTVDYNHPIAIDVDKDGANDVLFQANALGDFIIRRLDFEAIPTNGATISIDEVIKADNGSVVIASRDFSNGPDFGEWVGASRNRYLTLVISKKDKTYSKTFKISTDDDQSKIRISLL